MKGVSASLSHLMVGNGSPSAAQSILKESPSVTSVGFSGVTVNVGEAKMKRQESYFMKLTPVELFCHHNFRTNNLNVNRNVDCSLCVSCKTNIFSLILLLDFFEGQDAIFFFDVFRPSRIRLTNLDRSMFIMSKDISKAFVKGRGFSYITLNQFIVGGGVP